MSKLVIICLIYGCFLSSFAYSWDIAIGVNKQIEFYKENGSRVGIISQQFEDVGTITYDILNQTLYFVDNRHKNISIFAFHMGMKNSIEHIVKKNNNHKVLGIAVDPISEKLFWTVESNDSIFWMSLKNESDVSAKGKVFIKLSEGFPQHLVVDSCRGTIYWTNYKKKNSCIERASVDGSNHKVIIQGNLTHPTGITLQQGMRKIFWSDKGSNFKIESASLDGENRDLVHSGLVHSPYHIGVSDKAVYWTDWTYKKVWMISLQNTSQLREFKSFRYDSPTGVVVNNDLLEQTKGIPECAHIHDAMMDRLKIYADQPLNNGIVSNVDVPEFVLNYCNNVDDNNATEKCKNGLSNYRYMLCYNYCLNGMCSIDDANRPQCRCHKGFFGARCEYNVCWNHCFNNASCVVNEDGLPVCECTNNSTGDRCEVSNQIQLHDFSCAPTTTNSDESTNVTGSEISDISNNDTNTLDSEEIPVVTNNSEIRRISKPLQNASLDDRLQNATRQLTENKEKDFFEIVQQSSASLEDCPECVVTITLLSVLCVCLITVICLLVLKINALKKRPRINKRFIVNKNVTPLTSRPQCEVTIENCCNMNICETPCFEPKDFIEQVQEAAKKEEKKHLLLNMHLPEDSY